MRGVETGRRNRMVDAVLVGLILIAAAWLGRLVYHNYFGGHAALEFAEWTIPVAEGTRIVDYDDPPSEARTGRVEMVEDLVVGPRGEDPDYLFFQPSGVAVDADGLMYVVDRGNRHVQVFDDAGEHVRTLGQEGQGPGELQRPAGVAIAGNRVIVSDQGNRRLSIWDLDGMHLGDAPVSGRFDGAIYGTQGGSFVGGMPRRLEDRSEVVGVALFSIEGTATVGYVDLAEPEDLVLMGDGGGMVFPRLTGGPSFAATTGGDVYATAGQEYQILAFDSSGAPRWALRAARPQQAFTEEHKDAVLAPIRDRFEDLAAMPIEWPGFVYTISRLAIDGHGHLYVFPHYFRDFGPQELPVEVYSPQGERLFAGTMSEGGWSAARGDFVYSMRRNEQTEERELVRFRLVEPFYP